LPITAVDSITLALEHSKQQLFKPFRIGQWTKLAFVGMLAGELGSGGCNRFNFPHPSGPSPHIHFPAVTGIDPALIAAIATGVVAALAIGLILMFVGSVMRFILFDSIIARECHIRLGWNQRLGPGWRYFTWKVLYVLLSMAGLGVLVGIPAALALSGGWFRQPHEHLPALVLCGIAVFLLLMIFFLATAVIVVLTKDFVVPQMALENVDVMEGWRRLWHMMGADKGAYVIYLVMKMVLAFVAAILVGIATLILGLVVAIPSVIFGLLAVITGKSAGLSWNANTITLAVVVGCLLLGFFFYLVSLVSVPVIVFFPAYSIYFFAGRYPRLSAALYPAPSAPNLTQGVSQAPL
jgi:hypothetical protein